MREDLPCLPIVNSPVPMNRLYSSDAPAARSCAAAAARPLRSAARFCSKRARRGKRDSVLPLKTRRKRQRVATQKRKKRPRAATLLLRRRPRELARTREAATLGAAFIRACTGFFICVVAVDVYLRIRETIKADQHASSLQACRPEIIISKWLMWQFRNSLLLLRCCTQAQSRRLLPTGTEGCDPQAAAAC